MYTVFIWIDDHCSEPLGYFMSEYDAFLFMMSYAHLHCCSVDDLVLGHQEKDKFLETFKESM